MVEFVDAGRARLKTVKLMSSMLCRPICSYLDATIESRPLGEKVIHVESDD